MDKKLTPIQQDAVNYGIDLSIIEDNLSQTPTERVLRLEAALDLIQELKKAKKYGEQI
ncbi:hypothetical protein K1X76_08920 [bacterium]|nr:hypothetical protein [bacterium]